jgi:hypothetical protein
MITGRLYIRRSIRGFRDHLSLRYVAAATAHGALLEKRRTRARISLRDVAQYSSSLSVDLPALSACAAGSCSGALWSPAGHGRADGSIPSGRASTPSYANPALGEGPLGEEDRNNFHP